MPAIPQNLDSRLRATLLRCGPFDSNSNLRAAFTDARIYPWRDYVPEAANRATRVDELINTLLDRTDDRGQSALVLVLRVLGERVAPGDSCRLELITLADELSAALGTPAEISPSILPEVPPPVTYNITVKDGGQVGAIGNETKIEGGAHFGDEVLGARKE